MRKDKEAVIKLREQGESYSQISEALGVSKSTLSLWLRDIPLSQVAQAKIAGRVSATSTEALIKRNKAQTGLALARATMIKAKAKSEVPKLIKSQLFVTGVSLYWAEGYKKGAYGSKWKCVDFANSDPEMVVLMMRFFQEVCQVTIPGIKIQLIAHANIDIEKEVAFWSKLTQVPESQFIRTSVSVSSSSKGKRAKNCLTHGTVHVRIYDVKLFFRLIGWIEGLKEQFVKSKTLGL